MELSTAKRNPPPWEVVYNISKKINSKAMPLKAFWLGKSHLLCRWSFTENPEYFHESILTEEYLKEIALRSCRHKEKCVVTITPYDKIIQKQAEI